jgi:hypothetical protein
MGNKGTILGKYGLGERVGLYSSFTTKNRGASTTTIAEKQNESMDRVTGSRVV